MAERILIIDDEDHIRRMMRLALQASGYRVGEAKDGAEGIDRFGNGSRWDVVILDQRMPGLNGLETLAQLKQRNPNTRVVMATAYASIELAVDAMPAPERVGRLLRRPRVEKILDDPSFRQQGQAVTVRRPQIGRGSLPAHGTQCGTSRQPWF